MEGVKKGKNCLEELGEDRRTGLKLKFIFTL
jgi:hypothetical protein